MKNGGRAVMSDLLLAVRASRWQARFTSAVSLLLAALSIP
jgi:hypothetical protein